MFSLRLNSVACSSKEKMGKNMKTKILIENSDCSSESSYCLSLSQWQKILFGEVLYFPLMKVEID